MCSTTHSAGEYVYVKTLWLYILCWKQSRAGSEGKHFGWNMKSSGARPESEPEWTGASWIYPDIPGAAWSVQDRGSQGPLFRTSNRALDGYCTLSDTERGGGHLDSRLETKNCKLLMCCTITQVLVQWCPALFITFSCVVMLSWVKYGLKERGYIRTFIHKVIRILDYGYFGFVIWSLNVKKQKIHKNIKIH